MAYQPPFTQAAYLIPNLSMTNYHEWYARLHAACCDRGTTGFMTGPEHFRDREDDEDEEDYEDALLEHDIKRDKVWCAINNSVGDVRDFIAQYGYTSKDMRPHVMLACIKAALGKPNDKKASQALLALLNMRMENYGTPAAFISELHRTTDILDGTDFAITDQIKTLVMLNQLESIAPVFIGSLTMKFEYGNGNLTFLQAIEACTLHFGNSKASTMASLPSSGGSSNRSGRRFPRGLCQRCNIVHTTDPRFAQCNFCKRCHTGREDNCYLKHPEKRPQKKSPKTNTADSQQLGKASS